MPESNVADVIDSWREQVLDLTRRNDLVDVTATKTKSLPLNGNPVALADQLRGEGEVPLRKESAELPSAGREPETASETLTELQTRHRQYRRERGVDALYLALGRLHWIPGPNVEPLQSPLFLLPVDLERRPASGSSVHEFAVTYDGGSMYVNPALEKKLEVERGLTLFDDEPVMLSELESAFDAVDSVAASFDGWAVSRDVILCLFDFTNISIYEDLDRNRAALLEDPHVRAIVGEHTALNNKDHAAQIDREHTDEACDDEGHTDGEADRDGDQPNNGESADPPIGTESPFQVLEADPSQRRAIDAAIEGESFVLEGPPGTGKSQTIANVIAEKLGRGESVLFVSEKQAALDVVQNRLSSVGLGQFCLPVHGQQATRESVLSAIESVEHHDDIAPPTAFDEALETRQDIASSLTAYTDLLLDAPGDFDITVFEALGIVSRLSDLPDFEAGITEPLTMNQSAVDKAVKSLEELATYEDPIRNFETHPWRYTSLETWHVDTGDRMRQSIEAQIDALETLQSLAEQLDDQLGLQISQPSEIAAAQRILGRLSFVPRDRWDSALFDEEFRSERVRELAQAHREREELRSALGERYESTLLSEDGQSVHARLNEYGLLRYVRPSYYELKRQLTTHARPAYEPGVSELRHDARKLRRLQTLTAKVSEHAIDERYIAPFDGVEGVDWAALLGVHDYLRSTFQGSVVQSCADGSGLGNAEPAKLLALYERLREASESLRNARAFFADAMVVDELTVDGQPFAAASFKQQQYFLENLRSEIDRLQDWIQFTRCRTQARDTIAGRYLQSFFDKEADPSVLVDGFRRGFYRAWLNEIYDQTPLSTFSRSEFEYYLDAYREADEAVIDSASSAVQHAVTSRLPNNERGGPSSDQAVVLRREFRKQRHRRPLRELFAAAGDAIKRRKPCFMMSPRMVARCLTYGDIAFDTLIFDEASQIPPAEAASALILADQVIVAGDSRQLPPTRFFDSDNRSETDLESILDEASTVFPKRRLSWHYRSRSPSLIEFSNERYYDGRLRAFPERSDTEDAALSFEHVPDGVYHRGDSRTNPVEAQRVADIVTEHAETRPSVSLGVVAFSRAQERAIRSALADRRAENPELDAFLVQDDVQEEFFVKSLEVVQGDERDRILFSVGYGPDENGTMTMNFGPLNRSGGHRRLNVAVTRARKEVTVVSSILPEDIDTSATESRGVADFKRYLTHVKDSEDSQESGDPEEATGCLDEWSSPIVADVYETLTDIGIPVDTDAGGEEYTFDLVVRDPVDPAQTLFGIEIDGTIARRCSSTRERDRLRQAVLGDRGWDIHRVWAPSWAADTEREIRMLVDRIEVLSEGDCDELVTTSLPGDERTATPDGGSDCQR